MFPTSPQYFASRARYNMSALWSFGSVDIFVDSDTPSREVYRAKLKILDKSTNTLHFFGGGSEVHAIAGLVIGESNKDQLESDAVAGTSRTFTSDLANQGTFVIDEYEAERVKFSGAVIDGVSYDVDTAIYRVGLTLINTA